MLGMIVDFIFDLILTLIGTEFGVHFGVYFGVYLGFIPIKTGKNRLQHTKYKFQKTALYSHYLHLPKPAKLKYSGSIPVSRSKNKAYALMNRTPKNGHCKKQPLVVG